MGSNAFISDLFGDVALLLVFSLKFIFVYPINSLLLAFAGELKNELCRVFPNSDTYFSA